MSEKWCSAGKCECEHVRNGVCRAWTDEVRICSMQQCPWPSRQVRLVDPLNPLGEKNKLGLCPTMTDDDSPNVACYKLGYNVGFNKALDVAIEFLATLRKVTKTMENK